MGFHGTPVQAMAAMQPRYRPSWVVATYLLLADAVVFAHFLFVVFVVAGGCWAGPLQLRGTSWRDICCRALGCLFFTSWSVEPSLIPASPFVDDQISHQLIRQYLPRENRGTGGIR